MNESHVLNNLNHKNNQRKKDKKIFHVIENCDSLTSNHSQCIRFKINESSDDLHIGHISYRAAISQLVANRGSAYRWEQGSLAVSLIYERNAYTCVYITISVFIYVFAFTTLYIMR